MSVEFFRSSNVSWKQGVRLQRVRWHSCMQWGWSAINSGERLARWSDYWVLSVCWRRFGACWHWNPRRMTSTGAAPVATRGIAMYDLLLFAAVVMVVGGLCVVAAVGVAVLFA